VHLQRHEIAQTNLHVRDCALLSLQQIEAAQHPSSQPWVAIDDLEIPDGGKKERKAAPNEEGANQTNWVG